jgi:hypothetical protein
MVAYRSVFVVSEDAIALLADRNMSVTSEGSGRGTGETDRKGQNASFCFQIQRSVFTSILTLYSLYMRKEKLPGWLVL